jgi:hypothetical protein
LQVKSDVYKENHQQEVAKLSIAIVTVDAQQQQVRQRPTVNRLPLEDCLLAFASAFLAASNHNRGELRGGDRSSPAY